MKLDKLTNRKNVMKIRFQYSFDHRGHLKIEIVSSCIRQERRSTTPLRTTTQFHQSSTLGANRQSIESTICGRNYLVDWTNPASFRHHTDTVMVDRLRSPIALKWSRGRKRGGISTLTLGRLSNLQQGFLARSSSSSPLTIVSFSAMAIPRRGTEDLGPAKQRRWQMATG